MSTQTHQKHQTPSPTKIAPSADPVVTGDDQTAKTLDAINSMAKDAQRLKQVCPYYVVWSAYNPGTNEQVTGATKTKRQMNEYMRKGWIVSVYQ